jgi:hypothetical protein
LELDKTLIITKLKDLMKLGLMTHTPYMPLLTIKTGKGHCINTLNITITSLTGKLISAFLNSPSEEKLKPIISSFQTKFGLGSKLMENNTPIPISPF